MTEREKDPQDRLKLLVNSSYAFEVDPSIPPQRYYRSGVEMVRQADVYLKEGNLENAYVLYLKFMTLFIEKIRNHPDYNKVAATTKQMNQKFLRDVLPKTESLKERLLQQYRKEYNLYKFVKEKEKEEEERKQREKAEKALMKKSVSNKTPDTSQWTTSSIIQTPVTIDNVIYPDISDKDARYKPTAPCITPPKPTIQSSQPSTKPAFDRSTKPSIVASTTLNTGLRTVVIPSLVMPKFLVLARYNTTNNIETCGILAGVLDHNKLIITHMIIPKQKGTADSCVTMNEEELFDLQDEFSLITIGWIHTHPTQTAFLSSVDLHTQCPYQLLMPEAIAIVCAPKYNDTGIFVLTPNYGLPFISSCKEKGFHPHPTDPPLFMTADHIEMDSGAPLEVLDLR